MLFICYPKCTTCIKAKKFLDDRNVKYDFRDIKVNNPSEDEIKEWFNKYHFDLKKSFNTSGLIYKELNLKEKMLSMNENQMIELLSSNGMLIKRPILITDKGILFGFKEDKYKELINM